MKNDVIACYYGHARAANQMMLLGSGFFYSCLVEGHGSLAVMLGIFYPNTSRSVRHSIVVISTFAGGSFIETGILSEP